MPSNLSRKDVQQIREDLLRLKNAMHELRAESFALVCKKAEVALSEMLEMIRFLTGKD